jgi:flagellin-like hook-associated protein FlgL
VKTRAASLSDADYVDAATQLAFSQRALEASYAATAQGFKLSLLDYLR